MTSAPCALSREHSCRTKAPRGICGTALLHAAALARRMRSDKANGSTRASGAAAAKVDARTPPSCSSWSARWQCRNTADPCTAEHAAASPSDNSCDAESERAAPGPSLLSSAHYRWVRRRTCRPRRRCPSRRRHRCRSRLRHRCRSQRCRSRHRCRSQQMSAPFAALRAARWTERAIARRRARCSAAAKGIPATCSPRQSQSARAPCPCATTPAENSNKATNGKIPATFSGK
jgi:hypothetical protein